MEQIIKMYELAMNQYEMTMVGLQQAIMALSTAEDQLGAEQVRLIASGVIDGKNEQTRKAQMAEHTANLEQSVTQAKNNKQILEMQADILRRKMDMYKAILGSERA